MNTLLVRKADWDLLMLNEISGRSPNLHIMESLAERNTLYQERTQVPCPYMEFPDDWETFLKSLRPRMRTKIRSLLKGFGAESEQVIFDRLADPNAASERLESLFDLHGRRWQRKGQTGVFVFPGKKYFYNEITRKFLQSGLLRFYSLRINGEFVAHQFCFELDRTVFLLQEGYNPVFEEREVGNYLRALVFKDCIERGVKVYDFLGGASFHKSSWGGKEKESLRWTLAHPSVGNLLHFYLSRGIDRGKRFAKDVLPESVLEWRARRLASRKTMIESTAENIESGARKQE
jgi:CelD/BcsL family acetyltransferase involved in cellulose biosynthesis